MLHVFRSVGAVLSALYTVVTIFPYVQQSVTGGLRWTSLVSFLVFVGIVVWVLIEKNLSIRDLQSKQPRLELGEPVEYPNQILYRHKVVTDTPIPAGQHRITMFRVPVFNHGGRSSCVAVKLMKTEPALPGGMPVMTLHHTGDNAKDFVTFEKTFPLGSPDEEWVDVIAVTKDSPHQKCFIYSIASTDAMQELPLSGKYLFTLQASAETSSPPTVYQVDVDTANGHLSMAKL